jgi:cysteine desulfurase
MDYNASTPLREEVVELMGRVTRECYGNPSSAHIAGRMSKACIEAARRKVAEAIGSNVDEICFTSGGSESDNLAIKGAALARIERGISGGHIITTCIEHSAVKKTCTHLEALGFEVSCLPVDRGGYANPDTIAKAIRDDTFLITIMWANNEAGQIQPVEAIGDLARDRKILFHTDAVQAFGKIPVNVRHVPVDLLSISAHKFYGPKGVGILYIRRGIDLSTQTDGGGQESGLRSGTENVVGIAGMGEACRLAVLDLDAESRRLSLLRDRLEKGILDAIPETTVSGDPARRVPNMTNISFNGVEAGRLVVKMDELGFALSGASACASTKSQPSDVLMTGMGLTHEEALGALRFSLGRYSSGEHVDKLLELLPGVVAELRLSSSRRS